jgi:hypothetical protein
MEKIDKDTFLTDTNVRGSFQRAQTARLSLKNVVQKQEEVVEIEEENSNKINVLLIYSERNCV